MLEERIVAGQSVEVGNGHRQVREGGSREDGEEKIRGCSIEQLHQMGRSRKHFAVLLRRKFCSREQRKGKSVRGGRKGKLPIDREILERVKASYFVFHPTDSKEEEWKGCVTAINTFLRGEEHRYKSRTERPV